MFNFTFGLPFPLFSKQLFSICHLVYELNNCHALNYSNNRRGAPWADGEPGRSLSLEPRANAGGVILTFRFQLSF